MRKGKYLDIFKFEGIYYALFVAFVYLLTYTYVRNVQGYYHIPPELTAIDISLLIKGGFAVFLFSILFVVIIAVVSIRLPKDPFTTVVKRMIITIIVYRYAIEGSDLMILIYITLAILTYTFLEITVFPLWAMLITSKKRRSRLKQKIWHLVHRQKGNTKVINKLPQTLQENLPQTDYLIILYLFYLKRVQRFFKAVFALFPPQAKRILLVLTILVVSMVFSANIGKYSAETEDTYRFMELSDSGNKSLFVILGDYKDSYIVAPVDLKRKEITPRFRLVDFKTKPGEYRVIYTEKVGHLKVKSVKLPEKYKP